MSNNPVATRVLIVDDNPDDIFLVEDALDEEKSHFKLDSVNSGAELLAKENLSSYSIMLIDYNLPDVLGVELIEKVLKRTFIPIIIITGETAAEIARNAIQKGAQDFIVKTGDYYKMISLVIEKNLEIFRVKQTNVEIKLLNESLEQRVQEQTRDLKLANEQMTEAKELAEQANKSKSQFLASISHELRTPLHIIIGIVDLLLKKDAVTQNQEILSSLTMVLTSGDRLLGLVNDILDLSKLEQGKIQIEYKAFNLDDLLQGIPYMVSTYIQEKKIVFKLQRNYLQNQEIYSDQKKLLQILLNFLSNAVKFTTEGSVALTVDLIRKNNKPFLWLEIADSGIGIKKENIKRLFQPFSQIESEGGLNNYKGTGLGLAICKGFVDLMGGTIEIESEYEKGSIFRLKIPANLEKLIQKQTPNDKVASNDHTQKIDALKTKKILVCDDDDFNCSFMEMVLKGKTNYQIVQSGKAAIKANQESLFDLILMDIQMPGMNGIEAMQAIRKQTRNKNTPIMALTALAMKGEKDNLLALGFDNYLSKPFKQDDLLSKLIDVFSI